MIFQPAQARAILHGAKTQHRVTATTVKPGHDYAIQPGPGRSSIGRLRVLALRVQRLGDITYRDARAEGHKTTDAFKAAWLLAHDGAWVERKARGLGVATLDYITGDPRELHARFDDRHAGTPVTVILLEPLADQPRFLATQRDTMTGASPGGYTTNPRRAMDDLECVDDMALGRFAKAAGEVRRMTQGAQLRQAAAAHAAVKAERRRVFMANRQAAT